jgi:uncharacterized membrane protein YqjE
MWETQIQIERNGGGGLLGSARRFCETLLAIVHNRLELAAIELQEEKSRIVATLIWAALLIFFAFMTFVAVMITAILLFWDNRVAVAGGFAAFFLIGALVAFFCMKNKLKNPPVPFAETIAQLKKDRDWLGARS